MEGTVGRIDADALTIQTTMAVWSSCIADEGSAIVLMSESPVSGTDESLTRRGLRHALHGTTDLADRELRVPLHYYRDPKITEIEESQILRRVPLAIVPSAQVPEKNDYVVRSGHARSSRLRQWVGPSTQPMRVSHRS